MVFHYSLRSEQTKEDIQMADKDKKCSTLLVIGKMKSEPQSEPLYSYYKS